ncbi:MAG: hypothetical protein ACPGZP_01795 [Panacagrimonas sp.]
MSKEVCQLLVAIVVHGFVETASRVASSCRYAKRSLILLFAHVVAHGPSANKSLQVTFDPPPIFATAKTGVVSNAAELRRWATFRPGVVFDSETQGPIKVPDPD